jgi:osmoprotectant transport system permease protein
VARLIQAHTPYEVQTRLGLQGTKVCFSALQNGEIDLYVEYTGTGLANILNEEYDPSQSSRQILQHVRNEFRSKWGLVWLDPLGFNNTYAYAMRDEQAEKLGITKISDLQPYVKD